MTYAIIENNTILEYPINIRDALPDTSMRINWPGGVVDGVEYALVQSTPRPLYDSATQNIVEGIPTLSGSIWSQTWIVFDATTQEIESRLQTKRLALSCSPRQIRLALAGMGVLESIEAWVATQPGPARIEWEYATTILRSDPLVAAAAIALNMNDADLDALFEQARSL